MTLSSSARPREQSSSSGHKLETETLSKSFRDLLSSLLWGWFRGEQVLDESIKVWEGKWWLTRHEKGEPVNTSLDFLSSERIFLEQRLENSQKIKEIQFVFEVWTARQPDSTINSYFLGLAVWLFTFWEVLKGKKEKKPFNDLSQEEKNDDERKIRCSSSFFFYLTNYQTFLND